MKYITVLQHSFNTCFFPSRAYLSFLWEKSGLLLEASFFLMFKLTGGVEEIYSEIDRGLKRDHLIEEEI